MSKAKFVYLKMYLTESVIYHGVEGLARFMCQPRLPTTALITTLTTDSTTAPFHPHHRHTIHLN